MHFAIFPRSFVKRYSVNLLTLLIRVSTVFFVVKSLIFNKNPLNIFLEFRYMAYYQTPQKSWLHVVVCMNNSISSVNDCSCIGNFHCRVNLFYSIYSFSHDFGLALYYTLPHNVFFK